MAKFKMKDLDSRMAAAIVAAAFALFVGVFLFIGNMDSGPVDQQVSQNSSSLPAPGNEVPAAPMPAPSEIPSTTP